MKPVSIGLVGLGGYARVHLSNLRTLQGAGVCRIVAACDPYSDRQPEIAAALRAEGVQIYSDLNEMLARNDIDGVTIATPINLHATQTSAALGAGKSVYLEKPPCATLEELDAMIAASETARNSTVPAPIARVGFQMQSSAALRYVKQGISAGTWGKPEVIAASVRWPRDDDYYNRSPWAATWRQNGAPVFDGPATNALSHVVFAALFLGNEAGNGAVSPLRVRGSLMRARPVQSYDSILIEAELPRDVQLRLAFTHASTQFDPAALTVQCENAVITLDWDNNVTVSSRDGATPPERMLFVQSQSHTAMHDFINSVANGTPGLLPTLEETRGYVQLTCGALQSSAASTPGGAAQIAKVVETGAGGKRIMMAPELSEQMETFQSDLGGTPPVFEIGDKPWIAASEILSTLAV